MPSGCMWVLKNDLLSATGLIVVLLMKEVTYKTNTLGPVQRLLKSVEMFYTDFPFTLQLKN